MKNKKFWPEQIEEARTLAIQEKKFLTGSMMRFRMRMACAFSQRESLRN